MVLSKLKGVPGAVRARLPGGSDADRPDDEPVQAAEPDPESEAIAEGMAETVEESAEPAEPEPEPAPAEKPSAGERLARGGKLLTLAGLALTAVGVVILLGLRRLRRKSVTQQLMDGIPDRRSDLPTEVQRDYDGPRHAPLVGMAALVVAHNVVERLNRTETRSTET